MSSCNAGWSLSAAVLFALSLCLGILLLSRWVAKQRAFPGRAGFALLHLAALWWLLTAAAEMSAQAADCKMFWAAMAWPGIVATPTFWALFLWQYVNSQSATLRPRNLLLLCLMPLLAWLLALSNPWHGLFYLPGSAPISAEWGAPVHYEHGPLFFAVSVYVYLSMLFSVGTVLNAAYLSRGRHRRHYLAFAAVTLVPFIAHIAYVHYNWTVFGFDPTPLSFVFVLIAFVVLIFGGRVFDLLPVARHLLLEALSDPVLVINQRQEVIEANPAALQLAALAKDWQGCRLADWPVYGMPLAGVLLRAAADKLPPLLELTHPQRFFEVHRRQIERPARKGKFVLGEMLYLRDVTQPHLSEMRLAEALALSDERLKIISALNDKLRDQVLHDPLTGLFNRRYLAEFFTREQARARREHAGLVLVLIDLDHFKGVNDTYGHLVGDEMLKAVSRFFETKLRSTDAVFRFGGEEFLLLLTGVTAHEAFALVEGLREHFALTPMLTTAGDLNIQFSAGLASWPMHGDTLDDLIRAADSALYQAKREGRNRVRLAGSAS
ncbi:histidine kinase N-terminal 7TM domain-containing diguanylate cyclase [Pseudomonas sp. N040]|uniref:histidine kinase N-terminal 7TM domain-containing diguanylate cyclase n=1 Tax=Pseudomonas sp. N040 TaxID=2785325 RepID=UPI0018A29E29|nr:diguanylate cyclase [Pseudomonas sp. N040]MBF7728566.1 diguanylate cyclase [Pseudomonas sp. N040]MBW7012206.1 diguanylate cyclase [Pseudomonas sp. N040]